MLMPSSVDGVRTLLSVGFYKNYPLPNFLLSDFLKVCFLNTNLMLINKFKINNELTYVMIRLDLI
jgi:hypothetical protein